MAPTCETAVIEVNAGPGLRMHVSPTEGTSRDVGSSIMEMIYPEGETGRIPIASVTGTNGKTTVTRMIGKILAHSRQGCVGMTTSDGIYVDGTMIEAGDTTGPFSARLVLSDPTVDVAVLEVARGGLVRGGLGYDWSDVGVVTNIRPDHIGQDGIEDIEDLVRIKSVVPERVREGGTIVLNADDEESSKLMDIPRLRRIERKVVYYTIHDDNPLVRAHIESGGQAFFVRDGCIYESLEGTEHKIGSVRELPSTLRGAAWFQVSNAIAALAACRGLGIDRARAYEGLRSFDNGRENLGRMNIYRVRSGYVILDYAHNPDAIEAMAGFLRAVRKRTCAILGLPGDRTDRLLSESAKIAAHGFDRLVLRDDVDLRGRKPGEVPEIICRAAEEERPDVDCSIILDEEKAVGHAIETMQDGEVLVLFYDKYDEALRALRNYDPVPIESIDEFFKNEFRIEEKRRENEVHGGSRSGVVREALQ